MIKKHLLPVFASVVALVGTGVASASVDFSPLTDAIDFDGVGSAVMTAAGLLAGVYIVWKGASLILGALRRL
jgi:hypothetical protein